MIWEKQNSEKNGYDQKGHRQGFRGPLVGGSYIGVYSLIY